MVVVVVSSNFYQREDAEEQEECTKTESGFAKLLCTRKQRKGDKRFWKDAAGKATDKLCLISFLILFALNNIVYFGAVAAKAWFWFHKKKMFLFEISDRSINLTDTKNYFNRIDECSCFQKKLLIQFLTPKTSYKKILGILL